MAHKLYLTPQRKVVYDTVLHAANHPSASEIIEFLRDTGHKLAYGTVYNSLRYLTDAGLLRELHIGDTVVRYDARTEAHHHIVCRICGRVDEVLADVPGDYGQAVEMETGYRLEELDLVVKGVCPQCQANH